MFLKSVAFAAFFLIYQVSAFAQELPEIKKRTYTDSLKRYYHNLHLPSYFFVGTAAENSPAKLSNDTKTQNDQLPFYFKTEGRNVIHLNSDEKNKQIAADYVVYVDGTAPKSTMNINSKTKFKIGNRIFCQSNAILRIAAKDVLSGIDKTFISINGEDYKEVEGEVFLQNEGEYLIQYFSSDNVGNVEPVKKLNLSLDLTPPVTNLKIANAADSNSAIISAQSKLVLINEDNLSGVSKVYYKLDNGAKTLYNGISIPILQLENGNHQIEYFAIDNVENKENIKYFDFYLDKISPIVTTDVLGDRFFVNEKIYFSGRTKLKFTAVDNKSGVKSIFYSIDAKNFIKYEDPFYMPTKSGVYTIRYYALDNVGNQGAGNPKEKIEEFKHNGGVIYVDLTGPTLAHQFVGHHFKKNGINYITNTTLIKLSGSDPESGCQKLTYRFDSLSDENLYKQPFSIQGITKGEVDYYGYDNVNNRNVGNIRFEIDKDAPQINLNFNKSAIDNKKGIEVYPSNVSIEATLTDEKSGVAFTMYAINGGDEKLLKGTIAGFEKNKIYKIRIRAVDNLANKAIKEVIFYTK